MRIACWHVDHCKAVFIHGVLRGFEQAGHDVVSIAAWNYDQDYPGYRWPRTALSFPCHPRTPVKVPREYTDRIEADLHLYVDAGERFVIEMEDESLVRAFWSFEGLGLAASTAPLKYVAIRAQADAPAPWLPTGFDPSWVQPGPPWAERTYDLVQVSSLKDARQWTTTRVARQANPKLVNTFFGEVWGPPYYEFLRHARLTWVDPVVPFVPARVWDAMAAGCVVLFPAPAAVDMRELFTPGLHYLEYDPVRVGNEFAPDPELVISLATESAGNRRLEEIQQAAYAAVQPHTWRARAERIVADVVALRG